MKNESGLVNMQGDSQADLPVLSNSCDKQVGKGATIYWGHWLDPVIKVGVLFFLSRRSSFLLGIFLKFIHVHGSSMRHRTIRSECLRSPRLAIEIGAIPKVIDPAAFERKAVPPVPKFQGTFDESHVHRAIATRIRSWTDAEKENVWELSGLYEGDIMLHTKEDEAKNGLVNTASRWPGGVVPYYIKEEDFDEEDIELIEGAMKEYRNNTCIRFRPYRKTDRDYITIEGKMSGCWSLVGRHDRGQVVNLQNPGCVKHGVIVHELMHALGFYHQQSAADRDEWVTIGWENVKPGKEHNFNRYDNRTVTDYGIGYDYTSVMHYSSHAFSRNGKPTITPKKEKVKLGQRKGLSGKDTLKLQEMYKMECSNQKVDTTEVDDSSDDVSIDWIFHSSY